MNSAPTPGEAQAHPLGPLAPLAAFNQFVVVLLAPLPNSKAKKLPLDPRTGAPSDAHNAANWLDYEAARATASAWGPTFTVGFVLTPTDPFWCLDIDGCATAAGWSPRALEICKALPGAVVEVSQSGRGLHLWGRGPVPPHSTKNIAEGLELYTDRRFIALGHSAVGEMAPTCPGIAAIAAQWFPSRSEGGETPDDGPRADWRGPTDDDDLIRRALASRSAASTFGDRASFSDLWHADEAALARAFPSTSGDTFDRSSADAALAQRLAFWAGCDVARIERLMRRSGLAREKWDDREDYLVGRTITNACRMQREVLQDKPKAPVIATAASQGPSWSKYLVAGDPLNTARALVGMRYTRDDLECLKHWQGSFYRWDGSAWLSASEADIRAEVYAFLEREALTFKATQSKVTNVVDALKGAAHLDSLKAPPCWLVGSGPPARELVACQNGMLHLPSGQLHPATPAFFNLNAVPYAFDPGALPPRAWLTFLHEVWPDDPEAIDALQEVFGYLLTPDTSQQKVFLIVGPKRSGKGTIARVLSEMLGAANVAGPTLASLATPFGLAPLVGKLAAIVSDARLGGRTDQKDVAENLLRISGEDRVEVERKFLPSTTMRLGVRFVLLTNELPRIADASGAMASRFVILKMTQSFLGREDPGLTSKLLRELPGVLSWAVQGWHRLRTRGYFVQPKSSAEAAQDLADLGSPIGAFVREECITGPMAEVERGAIFNAWREWCIRQGYAHPGTAATFGRDLTAAVAGIATTRPRGDGDRKRVYRGVGLKPVHDGPRSNPFLSNLPTLP